MVWPQGQKVALMGLDLHMRQVIALLSLLNSFSSSLVLAKTEEASKLNMVMPLLVPPPLRMPLMVMEDSELWLGVKASQGEGISCWLGSISE